MRKILMTLLLAVSLIIINVESVQAAEAYDVIHSEVRRYNSNEKESAWIAMAILHAADTCQVDPMLITAVMETESGFNFNAMSPKGAVGLMQLMPETAKSIGANPYKPLENVLGGALYLRMQLNRFAGYGDRAITNAVAAYNAGPQAVINAGGVPNYSETRQYVIRVANNYKRLSRMLNT